MKILSPRASLFPEASFCVWCLCLFLECVIVCGFLVLCYLLCVFVRSVFMSAGVACVVRLSGMVFGILVFFLLM